MMGEIRYRLLGPVGIEVGGEDVPLRPRQRAVLALLLLSAGRFVSIGNLAEALWGGTPPGTARAQVQADTAVIRNLLRDAGAQQRLQRWERGYRLDPGPGELDLHVFDCLVAEGLAEAQFGRWDEASAELHRALHLWQGPGIADVTGAFADGARAALEEGRLVAYESWAQAMLRAGRASEVIVELGLVRVAQPLRERLAGLVMLALADTGRVAEAMGVARELRRDLAHRHGIGPGSWFAEVERVVLTGGEVEWPALCRWWSMSSSAALVAG